MNCAKRKRRQSGWRWGRAPSLSALELLAGYLLPPTETPTLASQGINKNLAKEMRAFGLVSETQFEEAVARRRQADRCTALSRPYRKPSAAHADR
jgi:hypothetical protein